MCQVQPCVSFLERGMTVFSSTLVSPSLKLFTRLPIAFLMASVATVMVFEILQTFGALPENYFV